MAISSAHLYMEMKGKEFGIIQALWHWELRAIEKIAMAEVEELVCKKDEHTQEMEGPVKGE